MRIPFAVCIIVASTQVGCGKLAGVLGRERSHDADRVAEGPLTAWVERLQASEHASDCDRQLGEVEMRLAQTIDAKQAEIDAFAATLPPSKLFRRVQLGPIFVRELAHPAEARAGWQSDDYSWKDYDRDLGKLADAPMSQAWVSLDAEVRAILMDDENRIRYQVNMGLTRADFSTLGDVEKALQSCLADLACTAPAYSAAAAELVSRNADYRFFSKTRAGLEALKKWVDADIEEKTMRRNETVRAETGGRLVVPLDPGPFDGVKDQLAGYIQAPWTSAERHLEIEWTTVEANPGAYRMILETGADGRSFVSSKTRTVHLFPDVRAKSIAHEIGHVLGFPDYYYTTWNPETCSYHNEYTNEDIMSDPTYGTVTADEWQELRTLYPEPPAA